MKKVFEYGVIGKNGEMLFRSITDRFMEGHALFELSEYPYDNSQRSVGFSVDHAMSKAAAEYIGIEVVTVPLHVIEGFNDLPLPSGDECNLFLKNDHFIQSKKWIEDSISSLLCYYGKVNLIKFEPIYDHKKEMESLLIISELDFARAMASRVQYVQHDVKNEHGGIFEGPLIKSRPNRSELINL